MEAAAAVEADVGDNGRKTMNHKTENVQQTVVSRFPAIGNYLSGALAAAAILAAVSCSDPGQKAVELQVDPAIGQAVFPTPGDAANAFVLALENHDVEMLGKVLGSDFREVLPLEEVDREDVDRFIAAW